ncbi:MULTISPECIES: N-acetyltransferase [unclassified Lacticaseibacillus]|uniref:GNAT family N-acetyltransferase n=1 Tax=unclassified Lacticaseibacillus TaxID=2759744 RepID=UPI00194141DA|nr:MULTISPECIES: GNAT family N-acetyltransferase [unclassified Lacticaseibacillus]
MAIEIKRITQVNEAALRLPNQPFKRFGTLLVTRTETGWHHQEQLSDQTFEQIFPEENYQLSAIDAAGFALGAFEGSRCVALATFEYDFHFNRYLYLADLKVDPPFRRQRIAAKLLNAAEPLAKAHHKRGLCTIAQGSNLGANRFYLAAGFHIGGLNTNDYRFTTQEGDTDIYYYRDF